ncbi:MAG TPA: hypothetical protein VG847_02020 [Chitinophagaceae bacterium]|nr:hypothetical protein [Chitinophagaceae bacterium]
MDDTEGFEDSPAKRPQFLTVLCILTFIGSSLFIFRNAMLYANADAVAGIFSKVKNSAEKNTMSRMDSANMRRRQERKIAFGNMMNSFSDMASAGSIRKNAIGTIISSVITLLGALVMWRLRRIGFFIYILGTLAGVAVPLVLFGASGNSIAMAIFSQFFGFLFIALYALNYRSLR